MRQKATLHTGIEKIAQVNVTEIGVSYAHVQSDESPIGID